MVQLFANANEVYQLQLHLKSYDHATQLKVYSPSSIKVFKEILFFC